MKEMNDRELLELAAKAVGIKYDYVNESGVVTLDVRGNYPDGGPWNPLANDGDALRLAVKLRIEIGIYPASGYCTAGPLLNGKKVYCYLRDTDQDEYAATRRVIVSAAAEIGKSM